MASAASALPFVPFVLGLGVIFMSAGNVMYMLVGDILVFLSGAAFLKVLK
jgi:hypothetical protein